MTALIQDERRPTGAAWTDHSSDQLDQATDGLRQIDSMIAELEALLEEARQLRKHYAIRVQGPDRRG